MAFRYPKSLLPAKRSAVEIVSRHLAAMDNRDALREIYRKARESIEADADKITQAWRAEAEAERTERAAKLREVDSEIQEDRAALLASLPDEPPPPECDDETRAWYDSIEKLLNEDE